MLERETEVLVVGAGPVGLFTALSLVERGRDVVVIDKDWRGAAHSYALALHPHSLRLLDDYGAAGPLLEQGHKIDRVVVYRGAERAGVLEVSQLGGPFPFVLVVPQSALERVLQERLAQRRVKVLWNHQLMGFDAAAGAIRARIARMEKYSTGYPIAHTEWMVAKEHVLEAEHIVGADGYQSFVRERLGAGFDHVGAAACFSVYEFPSPVELGSEVSVVLQPDSTNVLWPLGKQRGRFSFQVDEKKPAADTTEALQALVGERAPWFEARIASIDWHTNALFERRLVQRFVGERVWLAGDAAHITGPVGSQSMNVGLREAHDLAERISSIHEGGGANELLAGYATERREEWSMLLGLTGGLQLTGAAPDWARTLAPRLLPCIPASGEDLRRLLEPIGLRLPP
jgi:2-polyprenyl-6-methoxyphenol hydroxylase-like FAD-dependent oxidoreductase